MNFLWICTIKHPTCILVLKQAGGNEQTYQNEKSEAVQHLGFFVLKMYENYNLNTGTIEQ